MKCSPCYREFRALQESLPSQTTRRSAWSRDGWPSQPPRFWSLVSRRRGCYRADELPRSQPTAASQPQIAELRTELDLRKYSVLRSEQSGDQPEPVPLPTGVVELTLLLPVGSEPGPYDIQVLDAISNREHRRMRSPRFETSSRRFGRRSTSGRFLAERTNSPSGAKETTGACRRCSRIGSQLLAPDCASR